MQVFFIPVLPFFEIFLTSNNALQSLFQAMLTAIMYHMCNVSTLQTLHWLSLADIFPSLNYASIALFIGIFLFVNSRLLVTFLLSEYLSILTTAIL